MIHGVGTPITTASGVTTVNSVGFGFRWMMASIALQPSRGSSTLTTSVGTPTTTRIPTLIATDTRKDSTTATGQDIALALIMIAMIFTLASAAFTTATSHATTCGMFASTSTIHATFIAAATVDIATATTPALEIATVHGTTCVVMPDMFLSLRGAITMSADAIFVA